MLQTRKKTKPVELVHGRKKGADAINFEERMRMSYFQRQYIRKAMDAHHRIIKNAHTKVDCHLDKAHDRVAAHHDLGRAKLMIPIDGLSGVVDTEVGLHLILRLPLEPAAR